MAVDYDPTLLSDQNYTLGVLCSEFYNRYGEETAEILMRICHQRGLALGRGLDKKGEKSFENAIKSFVAASEKTKTPAKLVSLEKHRAVFQGNGCPLGLNDRGRMMCEMMMTLDQGIIEEASGQKVKFKVIKTLAAGDPYCEALFELDE